MAATPAPAVAKTVMQGGVAPTVMASSASAQAPVVPKKGGWNSGHTFAVCAVAAVAIILAVVSFGKKGPVETVAQVNAPSASSAQGSPLGAPQVAATAPATTVPDDLMKGGGGSVDGKSCAGRKCAERADEAGGVGENWPTRRCGGN